MPAIYFENTILAIVQQFCENDCFVKTRYQEMQSSASCYHYAFYFHSTPTTKYFYSESKTRDYYSI